MPDPREPRCPAALCDRLREQTERALTSGALKPIPTEVETVRDGGLDFQVRIAPSLEDKIREAREQQAQAAAGQPADPFASPEPDLYLGPLSATHFGLLNKFPVLANHLLLITRAFEDQQAPLNRADFGALSACLAEMDGLGFYNAGPIAGASQAHKHLQLVPPLQPGSSRPAPVETLLDPGSLPREPGQVAALPFPHAACSLSPEAGAEELLDRYHALRGALGLTGSQAPYNFLVTRRWMLLVPRCREGFEGIMVNALGFAGGFLVRNRADFAHLAEVGPMRVLQGVAGTAE
jgi:ATP adenylyltransferase